MLRRRFGRTELQMPAFSCGGMRFQYKWQDCSLTGVPGEVQDNLDRTVKRAFELGINHIETARGYGSSERQLGAALRSWPRSSFILQSKVSPTENPKEFEVHVRQSLERLQVDHVDLLAIHGVNNRRKLEWTLRPGGCFDVAQRFRQEGGCRFIGFSTHGPLDVIVEAIRHGKPETGLGFDYVNLHWYFIMQRNWPAIVEAAARDMGVFIISPSDKGGRLYDPPPLLTELCRPLSPMVFNDLFCLSRPEVHTLSIGAARPGDFDEHLLALPLLEDAASTLGPIIARLSDAMMRCSGASDPEHITTRVPPFHELPGGVNLATILWLRNLAVGWGMVEYAKGRYNLLNGGDDWFPGARPSHPGELSLESLGPRLGASSDASSIVKLAKQAVEMLHGEQRKRLSQGQ